METTEQLSSVKSVAASLPTLRVLFTGEQGTVIRPPLILAEGRTQLGRSVEPPGISLPHDKRASRAHAAVYLEEGVLTIADEESRNGTFVNGQRLETSRGPSARSPLRDGDVVRIGDSFVLVREEPTDTADAASTGPLAGLLGRAPAMRRLRSYIKLVAPTPATVLLLGESGTGKEVVSRALHEASGRKGPFVAINCGAIPESLAESQLFGHVRGAFTGASPHPGLFRAAEGGTLLLDELGELPPALQPKLLRVLEERRVLPVGATQPVPCDVRVVAATNRDLGAAVAAGSFRGDLFARLAEFTLTLPPLRERREDILPLLERALDLPTARLDADLVERLLLYAWPFNVRELIKLASELRIRGAHLSLLGADLLAGRLTIAAAPSAAAIPPRPAPEPAPAPPLALPPVEAGGAEEAAERGPIPSRAELLALLHKHRGIIADIARETGRSRAQVYRWLKQHDLDATDFREPEPG
ncbi:MAG: sigma 54-interacting transcriptional regulator [Polyangia bacterium]